MKKDIRDTRLYQEAAALFDSLRQPGTGQISDAAEVHVSPDGKRAVFAGTIVDRPEGTPPTRICSTDLTTGDTRVLTFGPNVDRLPKFSPDGRHIAFLSDRRKEGDFQLHLLDPLTGAARPTRHVDGWAEYLHWSPDGTRILLGVAGHGADISGGQGAIASQQVSASAPSWMPAVEVGDETYRGRSAWIYEVATDRAQRVSPGDSNVWEASWCGHDRIAAVVSPGAGEGLWYTARLVLIDVRTGDRREMFRPRDQLGCPTASPSGKHLAVVEALCSDRGIVAGELRLIDTASGSVRHVDTHGVDIAYAEWRSNTKLLLAGHRGFETAVALCDAASGSVVQLWSSREITTGGRYVSVSGCNECGDCVLVGEGFRRAPEIAVIRNGAYVSVKSFDLGYGDQVRVIESAEPITWKARDELEIQGWLLTPTRGGRPHPLVMNVHGGPVWHSRPAWLGRNVFVLMLLGRGYAVFYPNPRGSAGCGTDFARHVYGDLGGADAQDLLSGLDMLVQSGIADAQRLGVTGRSYGGFMTSWLVTQDSRFGAAVATAPHTNQVTEHLISNIPHFMAMMTQDKWNNADGKYFDRSPIMHAHKAKTPTLNICGGLDRCTPPEEAVQFHNALRESGVKSVLVTYPEEGHGIRKLPAVIDYAARVVSWFEEHIPPRSDHVAKDT
jgi:dipeptidyl aminopeptidase/acylaminoacyl peptidase